MIDTNICIWHDSSDVMAWVKILYDYVSLTSLSNGFTMCWRHSPPHYSDVIMGMMASQITSLTIVYSTVYSDADKKKHQSSASLAFVWGIHQWSVNFLYKWTVTRKMFLFDDVIIIHSIKHYLKPNITHLWYQLTVENHTKFELPSNL